MLNYIFVVQFDVLRVYAILMFLVIGALVILFAKVWLRFFPRGPLEYVWDVSFRFLTGRLGADAPGAGVRHQVHPRSAGDAVELRDVSGRAPQVGTGDVLPGVRDR